MNNPLTKSHSHFLSAAQQLGLDTSGAKLLSGDVFLRFIFVLAQIGLLWWLVDVYAVEDTIGIIKIMPLVFGGFLIHAFLPQPYKIHFFLMLGISGIFVLLQWDFALILLALILLLFAICILPLAVKYRAVLLLLAGATLAWLWGWQKGTIAGDYLIMPIVGSIFMFRASVFLYDQQFEKQQLPLAHRFAYFMMLPNLVFTLFPVVDYKIFKQSYYSSPPIETYQQGIRWMVRGFFHLMLYRIIYYYYLPGFQEVNDFWTFMQFALTNYLLILRLSGLFHFATGILCLFGWNLPPVFNNYFLASGFSDLWRRINVYWRDYMMKIYYYPIYFRLRKIGKTSGMVVSIWIVFAITWLLHSYQWFWLKGSFPLRLVDALFWAIFGILVSINSVYQQRKSKNKKGSVQSSPMVQAFSQVSQIVAMFIFMCFLWTFWSSPTVSDWLNLVSVTSVASAGDWLILFALIGGVIITGSILYRLLSGNKVQQIIEPDSGGWGSVSWSFASLIPFVMFLNVDIQQSLGVFTDKPVTDLLENKLNVQDQDQMLNGYYEDILITNNLATPLADLQQRPGDWVGFSGSEVSQPTGDWRQHDIRPATSALFKGAKFSTNKWGMRDRAYELNRPDTTIRFGIVGGSYVTGSGVNDDEVFDVIVEKELSNQRFFNKEFELLNFSVPGYHLLHCIYKFEHEAINFDLDGLMLFTHSLDMSRLFTTLVEIKADSVHSFSFPFLQPYFDNDSLDLSRNTKSLYFDQIEITQNVLKAAYQYLGQMCEAKGIKPILVYWPRTRREAKDDLEFIVKTANEAGFLYIDLSEAYGDLGLEAIWLAKYDHHPNKLAHEKIAALLLQKIKTQEDIVNWLKTVE